MNGRLREFVSNPWFSLADLLLVIVSGLGWILIPAYGVWFTIPALLPLGARLLAGRRPLHRTPFDWLIAIFLITAWIGYWAAYDTAAAWAKVWLIVIAIMLYYALSGQPKENLDYVSALSFCLALAISIHFFLTYDFTVKGGWLANWWMNYRPQVNWPAIHHGYTSGLVFLAGTFASYSLWRLRTKTFGRLTFPIRVLLALGVGVIAGAFLLTVSRGVWAIVIGALLVSILWKAPEFAGLAIRARMRGLFPVLVLGCLAVLIALVYIGPANRAGTDAPGIYGSDSRAELLARSAYLLADYPLTGGGLNSFPGLYSEYLLRIPHFYFTNSYNMFMDVAVEQGLVGGLAFFLICLGSVWLVAKSIVNTQSAHTRFFSWLSLLALLVAIVHGLFYDYLYNGTGTLLVLFPAGASMIGVIDRETSGDERHIALGTSLPSKRSSSWPLVTVLILIVLTILGLNAKKVLSTWYSDLGAVQLSRVELKHFPTNHWLTPEIAPELQSAQDSLRSAIQYDPRNETANYRLGIISMLGEDFPAASRYLALAHAQEPNHRGIIKSLGYCQVWMGNLEEAQALLAQIPEAQEELKVYVWWWTTQGRPDLSANAFLMVSRLEALSPEQMVSGSNQR